MTKPSSRVLGTFTIAMITMAAIISLRNLSLTAELGISAVFFLSLAAIVFFIPSALIVAELAAAWPRPGGCYVWVGEAFGKPLAFVSLWMSWMASVAWFPALLAFTATMLGHMLAPIFPNIEANTLFILICMLVMFWSITLGNFFGIELSGLFSSSGVIIGTLLPGALIILLGFWWVLVGNPSHIPLSFASLIPDLQADNLSLFAGVILGLAGIELAAYHISDTKDPKHTYPRAVLLASISILFVYIFGTLAIAIVVPQYDLSLASGLVQAFAVFFAKVGLPWLVPFMAACLLLGALASLNAWIIGPAKGLLIVAQDGFLPDWLRRVNKHGVPTSLLIAQAIVGSALSLIFIYIRNSNTSIWILTAVSAQFTCLVYILIFAACLKLRYKQSATARPFKVAAVWPVALSGIASCIFGFAIVYIPHAKLVAIEYFLFNLLLIVILVLLLLPTWWLIDYRIRSRRKAAK